MRAGRRFGAIALSIIPLLGAYPAHAVRRPDHLGPASKAIFSSIHTFNPPSTKGLPSGVLRAAFVDGDGATPTGDLVSDRNGNLFGTTTYGGVGGAGTVFEIPRSGAGYGSEAIVYSFGARARDGRNPFAGLIIDGSGALYGTTAYGGSGRCYGGSGCGTIFKLAPTSGGAAFEETVLYNFAGIETGVSDGEVPLGRLFADSQGDLYGTTFAGGKFGIGTVYELPRGAIQDDVLYSFGTKPTDGWWPTAGLIAETGSLFGTASTGGQTTCGCGTVFKLSRSSGGWDEETIYSFLGPNNGADGANPNAGLLAGSMGRLFGTTYYGGKAGAGCDPGQSPTAATCGIVFELVPSGPGYSETVLYRFSGFADNGDTANPLGGLALDASGNLYGTASYGGNDQAACALKTRYGEIRGCGGVFELPGGTPATSPLAPYYDFCGGTSNAQYPQGGLLLRSDGTLFGATIAGGSDPACSSAGCGTIFELSPTAEGASAPC